MTIEKEDVEEPEKMLKLINGMGLIVLGLLAVINTLQIQRLNANVDALQTRLQNAENHAQANSSPSVSDAIALLAQARQAAQNTDWNKARQLAEQAAQAGRTVGEHAGPALDWVQKQAQTLKGEIDKAGH